MKSACGVWSKYCDERQKRWWWWYGNWRRRTYSLSSVLAKSARGVKVLRRRQRWWEVSSDRAIFRRHGVCFAEGEAWLFVRGAEGAR